MFTPGSRACGYKTASGRHEFLNPDPIGFGGGLNFYAFANGNPISYIDPFGLGAIGENVNTSWVNPSLNIPGMYQQMGNFYASQNSDTFGNTLDLLANTYENYQQSQAARPAWVQQVDLFAQFVVMAMAPEAGLLEGTTAAKTETMALQRFYPVNNGFADATERTFLMPGQTIDRYGGSGYSRFFSPAGTAEAARALPPGTAGQSLRSFEVMKPFEVQSGSVAPWFNQPGGGLQYVTPVNLETLLKRGILNDVTP